MILHLGVIDLPYASEHGITTGDVAQIIEEKYGLLGDGFVGAHLEDIAQILAEAQQQQIEALFTGVAAHPFAGACAKITTLMKRFLTSQEAERVGLPGVPTGAALKGVNKRLKAKRGPRRPSFIDSSEMVGSYTSWTTEADTASQNTPAEATP